MPRKKKHWTQTARGRAHMRRVAKARFHRVQETPHDSREEGRKQEIKLAHIQGKVQAYIELHALSSGLPYSYLAAWLRKAL